MENVVVLFTKPFGAYAKGDRAGFDAEAAQRLKDLGVAKSDGEPEAEEVEQELDGVQTAQVGAAVEQPLPEQVPDQQVTQGSELPFKPAGKAPKGAKA